MNGSLDATLLNPPFSVLAQAAGVPCTPLHDILGPYQGRTQAALGSMQRRSAAAPQRQRCSGPTATRSLPNFARLSLQASWRTPPRRSWLTLPTPPA